MDNNQPPRRRFRLRFSLRTLLILIALCAVGVAWVVRWDQRARWEREFVAAGFVLNAPLPAPGEPFYSWGMPFGVAYEESYDQFSGKPLPIPNWLNGVLDHHHFYHVVQVSLDTADENLLEQLPQLSQLEILHLHGGRSATQKGVKHLQSLMKLKELRISGISTGESDSATMDHALAAIQDLPRLTILRVDHDPTLTDEGLACLGKMSQLRELYIRADIQMSDKGLAHLGQLKQLELLQFAMQGCDQEKLDAVSRTKYPQLRTEPTTAKSLRFLPELKSLRTLQLTCGAAKSPEALSGLRELPQLSTLELRAGDQQVTDETLSLLGQIKTLKSLFIDGRDQATDAGIASLKAALPNCTIKIEPQRAK